jgi:hypothetical protein
MQPALALLLHQIANRLIFYLPQLLRVNAPAASCWRACLMASGRKKLPTISARNGA